MLYVPRRNVAGSTLGDVWRVVPPGPVATIKKAASAARPCRVFGVRQIRKGKKAVGVEEGACPLIIHWEGWSEAEGFQAHTLQNPRTRVCMKGAKSGKEMPGRSRA